MGRVKIKILIRASNIKNKVNVEINLNEYQKSLTIVQRK